MSKKTSRDLRNDDDIGQWEARLAREWPERALMAEHVANHVAQLPVERPLVVELAVGSGYLAEVLLGVLNRASTCRGNALRLPSPYMPCRYIGFDRSPALLDYARRRVDSLYARCDSAGSDYELHLADVNEDGWVKWLEDGGLAGKIDAVVSLQSFHDFGKEPQQARVYRIVREILSPQGCLINADLLLNPQKPHPRRLPASRHLELLREAGFAKAECTLQMGELGCFVAVAR